MTDRPDDQPLLSVNRKFMCVRLSVCMCLLRVVFVIADRYLNSSYFKNSSLRFKHLFSFQIIVIHLKLILNKNANKNV